MKLFIIFTILSALFRAIDHIGLWGQLHATWLPSCLWNWKTRWRAFNAEHFYMGLYLMFFGLACINSPMEYETSWVFFSQFAFYLWCYFQIFNLFFHVVLKKKAWWEWPIFRIVFT